MKKTLLFLCFLFAAHLTAQPIIDSGEKYEVGNTYIYQHTELDPGTLLTKGAMVTWDLRGLRQLSERTTMNIVDPSGSKYASFYPGANVLEQSSDGTFVYTRQTEEESVLLGFVDEGYDFRINYPVNQLFMKRPIEYGMEFDREYATSYQAGGYSFSGHGATHIQASAYGELMLPNASYENVLLVILTQEQSDTLRQYNSVSYSKTETYIWFEADNPAPLLRVSIYESQQGRSVTASWLVKDQVSSSQPKLDRSQINIYPNPAVDRLMIDGDLQITERHFRIVDITGKTVISQSYLPDENAIDVSKLNSGMYFFQLEGTKPISFFKLGS